MVGTLVDIATGKKDEKIIKRAEEMDIFPEDDRFIISRKISQGKSVSKINGETVTVKQIKELAELLLDIHGQHEHQSLLNPSRHIRLLDRFCGAGFGDAMEAYKASFQALKEIDKQLDALMGDESQREQRMDILSFQKEEIESAALRIASKGCCSFVSSLNLGEPERCFDHS